VKPLYTLTQEDVEIFTKARLDGRNFTSFYMREPDQPRGWIFDDNIEPPWQLAAHMAAQTTLVIIGGKGSAKTSGVGASGLVWSTTVPNFKFLCVAPSSNQSYQMFSWIKDNVAGTLWEERFLDPNRLMVEKPYPKIHIAYKLPNGKIVRSIMEFMSAADDAKRILNYEGDLVVLDQAESVDNLEETLGSIGNRTRGKIKGRHRLGRVVMLANSDESLELWNQFDMAEEHPDRYLSILVSTYSNHNLTNDQIRDFELRLGDDPEQIALHLRAERPMGAGYEFKKELLEHCIEPALDDAMAVAREASNPQYEWARTRKSDVILWKMPFFADHDYVVIGDPGTGGPPGRNAPVVMALDMTDYPNTPARLAAFWWGNGGGSFDPFLQTFTGYIDEYHAHLAGYDSTGGQKVMSEAAFLKYDQVLPIDLSGIKKKMHRTTLKLLMFKNRLGLPRDIKGIYSQFLKYKLPDEKLPQDIVSCFFVWAGLMWAAGLDEEIVGPSEEQAAEEQYVDRYARSEVSDRYERSDIRS